MSIDIKLIEPYVVSALQKIGWHENRKIDISYWKAVLKNEGYIIFDYAEELLENFGGIEVNSIIATIYSCAQFDFDPLNAASGEFDRINYYQSTTHDQLYPIGSLVEGIAYVGLSKKIYWGSVDKIYLVGNCIENYLNNLFSWKKSNIIKLVLL